VFTWLCPLSLSQLFHYYYHHHNYHHYLFLLYSVVKVGVCYLLQQLSLLFSDLLKRFEKLQREELLRQKQIGFCMEELNINGQFRSVSHYRVY